MDARLYLFQALNAHCRQQRPNDMGDITWNDAAMIRTLALRYEQGDTAAWDTFLKQLQADWNLAGFLRLFLEKLRILRCEEPEFQWQMGEFPPGQTPLNPDDEAALLKVLCTWPPEDEMAEAFPEPHD